MNLVTFESFLNHLRTSSLPVPGRILHAAEVANAGGGSVRIDM
jgi:hypothetical protein